MSMKIWPIIWEVFIDLMSGNYQPLEPKTWDEAGSPEDLDAPRPFIRVQIIPAYQFLKDFSEATRIFPTGNRWIEIMLQKLYTRWGITDESDLNAWPRRITQFLILCCSLRKNIRDLTKQKTALYSRNDSEFFLGWILCGSWDKFLMDIPISPMMASLPLG